MMDGVKMNILLLNPTKFKNNTFPDLMKGYANITHINLESFREAQEVEHLLEAHDAVLFTGGPDVDPKYYGEERHDRTTVTAQGRCKKEMEIFEMCVDLGIPMIGVCRGAQLICVGAGGSLIQHVDGHLMEHDIKTVEDDLFPVTSTHHQMMYPFDVPDAKVLAWSAKRRATMYERGDKKEYTISEVPEEPEIVYFDSAKAIAVQGHPEYFITSPKFKHFRDYFEELVNDLVIKSIGK